MPCSNWTTITAGGFGKKAYTAKRAECPRMPMTIVHRQPSRLRVAPRMSMVSISAIWPRLITGMIQLPGMPTPPAADWSPGTRPSS